MRNATPQYNETGRCIGQLMDIISSDVLEATPGLQPWSMHKAPVIIFSAYREDNSAADNRRAHGFVLDALRQNKVPHKSALGVYKGVREQCIIVRCDTERHARVARIMAGARRQESILCLTGDRVATLETPKGEHLADLGKLCAVARQVALNSDAHTFTNGTYYICK